MDEEDFGDDDWDDIPDNTLLQIEQRVFTSTQNTKTASSRVQPKPAIQTYGTSGLTARNTTNDKGGWQPPKPRLQPPATTTRVPDPPSSDYGFDDEDVIDLDEPSVVLQSTSAVPSRATRESQASAPARSVRYGSRAPLDPETEAAFAAADAELQSHRPEDWVHAPHLQHEPQDGVDISSLQARIAELEAQQARLIQSEQEARRAAEAKQGEIAIVRSNQEKATKEYERRITVMQKLHVDEAAKQKAELEAERKEREKMETDNRFLQHDLAQEAERAKRLTGPGRSRVAPSTGQDTPRKAKRTAQGDGFDDGEVQMFSPSRSKDKSREQTPKVGAKRKRTALDSPVAALALRPQPKDKVPEEQPVAVPFKVSEEQSRYAFMQRTLNHRPYEGHERTVEALTKHTFPSNSKESLSSLFLNSFTLTDGGKQSDVALKLSRVMLRLWRRCLDEEYYKPIYLILDMVRFALRFELADTISQVLEEAVALCVKTVTLVMEAVFKITSYPAFASGDEFALYQTNVEPYIDVDETLDFMKQLCDVASLSPHTRTAFWRTVPPKTLLLMLNKAHPISQISTVLSMLKQSFTPTSFGCLADPNTEDGPQTQLQQEKHIIERLMSMLFETPRPPKDEPVYVVEEILEFRLDVLSVLKALCQYDYGGLQLAQYRTTIGRLIRFLNAQVCKLYTTPPSIGLELPADTMSAHTLVAETINATVRLVYHLLRAHHEVINLQQKLSVFKGGWHKFLISMTRIAFSDRLVFEEGLDDGCVEAAHQILDSVLSPEEGEAVVRAVETPRGTKGTSTEKDSSSDAGEGDRMEEDPG